MDGVRPQVRGRLLVAVVGFAAAMLVVAGGSLAAAGAQASEPPTIQGEEDALADVDNRRARAQERRVCPPPCRKTTARSWEFPSRSETMRMPPGPSVTKARGAVVILGS